MIDPIVEMAKAMRDKWGEIDDDGPLIPWEKSNKRKIWIEIAKAGAEAYEKAKGEGK